ncbi:hypothetical protein RND71_029183 [Anisodus tanguticus]|uniref:Uncharacterized protein n=1 Tax=Anisodus tanguticus TaxID=243964 RepID=A0AAE1V6Z2_9SOLA|nr:hypothetical protein RND71_029183 [Anisodus tanguticus]
MQVVAFATFIEHPSAMVAMHALDGVKFDPQTGSTLHIELARSNSRRVQIPGRGPYVVIDNRSKFNKDAEDTSSDEGTSFNLCYMLPIPRLRCQSISVFLICLLFKNSYKEVLALIFAICFQYHV